MMDSERPIEKMLRASAEKRRAEAGAPFEMHPATRRLLQGEITRTHRPAVAPRPAKLWLGALWLRVAGAVATIAILGLAARMVWNSETDPGESVRLANTIREENRVGAVAADESMRSVQTPPMAAVPEPSRRLLEPGTTDSQPAPARTETAASPALRSVPPAPSPAPGEVGDPLYARRSAAPPPGSAAKNFERDKRDELALGLTLAESAREIPAAGAQLPTLGDRPATTPPSTMATPSVEVAKSAVAGQGVLNNEPSTMGRSAQPMGSYEARKEKTAETEDLSRQALDGSGIVVSKDNIQGQRQLFYNQLTTERFGQPIRARGTALLEEVATAPQGPQAVLASFSVENTGREIRITDRDGSIYAGPVRLTNQQVLGGTFAATPSQVSNFRGGGGAHQTASVGFEQKNQSPHQTPQYYWFHVSGTNRTLNQKIEFEGNLAQNFDPALAANTQNFGLGLSNNSASFTNAQPQLFQNQAVISGRVVIDGKTEMKVNAQAAP